MRKLALALARRSAWSHPRRPAMAAAPIRASFVRARGGGADIIGRILADALQSGSASRSSSRTSRARRILATSWWRTPSPTLYARHQTAGQIIAAGHAQVHAVRYRRPDAGCAGRERSLLIATRPDFRRHREELVRRQADPGKIGFASPGFAATSILPGELSSRSPGGPAATCRSAARRSLNAVLAAATWFRTGSALIARCSPAP